MMEKKYTCKVIQDLLPLYQDDICSEESKIIVKEHLAECVDCTKMADCLKNSKVEEQLISEKDGVLLQHAKKEKKRTTSIGMITAGILMIPIIVCLICNLAVGHALDWFFIVLASLLVLASVTVVPLMKEHKRFIWTLGSFTISLVVLLGVINIYTQGKWFFIATIPTLFGLIFIFMPYILYKTALPTILQNKKGLIVMIVDTVSLYALIYMIGLYVQSDLYYRLGSVTTTMGVVFAWIVFLTIRYFKISVFSKAGLIIMETAFFTPIIDQTVDYLILGKWTGFAAGINVLKWTVANTEANIYAISIVACMITSLCFFITGFKNNKKK
jgi:predicted nucleic acid-binding Zn ribbon protein